MKRTVRIINRKIVSTLAASLAAAFFLSAGVNTGLAQALPPGIQDVVKLTQAGISEDVILSQIKNNQAVYNLTADQIILLKNQGVSQNVIKALISGGSSMPAPLPAVPAPATPPPDAPVTVPSPPVVVSTPSDATPPVTLDSFQAQLAPSGTWIKVPGLGSCWQPAVAVADPGWRPYFDRGHWIYTDAGWSWQSDYPWGNIVFHYGRWTLFNGGWIWVPGYDWAPAWVCWRQADGYCGWAPLPPGAVYRPGIGLYYNGVFAADVDFGLGMDAFMFVPYDHFWDYDYRPFYLHRDHFEIVFRDSHVLNGYRFDNGHFFIDGIGRDRIGLLTHHDVRIEFDPHGFHGGRDFHDNRGFHDNHGGFDRGGHDDHRDPHHF